MPLEHQALLFLVIAVVAWISATLPWLRIPTSVLEIVLGAVLGPHGFNFDQPGLIKVEPMGPQHSAQNNFEH